MAMKDALAGMKMPPAKAKKKPAAKAAPADDGEDLDALFGGKKGGEEGSDEEEAQESPEEEKSEDQLKQELQDFSDEELQDELDRRKNEGAGSNDTGSGDAAGGPY